MIQKQVKKFPFKIEGLDHMKVVEGTPSKVEFNRKYGFESIPIVLKDISKDWRALSGWTEDYLIEKSEGKMEVCERKVGEESEYKKFTLRQYFEYAKTNDDEIPYYLNNGKFHLNTSMEKDYDVPNYFGCWYGEIPVEKRKHSLSWVYIGAKGTYSALHLDIWKTSAWNCLISGKKLWLFYEPNQGSQLYDGQVNPFSPDLEKYPNFSKTNPIYCIQNPGDVVFTPSMWWHTVYNLETTISITENFINETNYQNVLDFFDSQNANKAHQSMMGIVKKNLELLK